MEVNEYDRDWHSIFQYDEKSPSGLVWKIPRLYNGVLNHDRIGKPVGSLREYWSVGLTDEKGGKKIYLVHRIIMTMFRGKLDDEMDVDHVDRNKSNNKIDNLRIVTKSDNMKNKDLRLDNKTGFIGVNREGLGFRAQFKDVHGKIKRKYFSENKYGDSALTMAVQWRMKGLENYDGS